MREFIVAGRSEGAGMRRVCDYPGCTSAPAFVLHWRGDERLPVAATEGE